MTITGAEEPEATGKRSWCAASSANLRSSTLLLALSRRCTKLPWGLVAGCRQFRGGKVKLCSPADTLAGITKTCAGWGSVTLGDGFEVWRADHHFSHARVKVYLNLDPAIETTEFVKAWLTAEEAYQSVTVISFLS